MLKKIDKALILAVSLLFVYWILIIVEPAILSPLSILYQWMRDFAVALGYWGSFLFSLIGNATVLFPFPYIGFPFILGGAQSSPSGPFVFDPWLIGIVSGIGAAIGEMTGYLLGYAGGEFIKEEKRSVFRNYALSHPRSTPILLWFLAVTPIPDDVLVIPLGAAKYPWWKVVLPQLLGKSMFLAAVAWGGRLGLSWIEEFAFANPLNAVSETMEVIVILAVVIVLYLMVRFDWVSHVGNSSS
ncbi:MAG: hypothetical protein EAX95_10325 [Candidatus Thorarchaeota archaeon]|nr:hypothetical protein [Candidatus Thorarchaeota archaeon]